MATFHIRPRPQRYEVDDRGHFCRHCGRSFWRHYPKNLFSCGQGERKDQDHD